MEIIDLQREIKHRTTTEWFIVGAITSKGQSVPEDIITQDNSDHVEVSFKINGVEIDCIKRMCDRIDEHIEERSKKKALELIKDDIHSLRDELIENIDNSNDKVIERFKKKWKLEDTE